MIEHSPLLQLECHFVCICVEENSRQQRTTGILSPGVEVGLVSWGNGDSNRSRALNQYAFKSVMAFRMVSGWGRIASSSTGW
jgi:hypothetical protein